MKSRQVNKFAGYFFVKRVLDIYVSIIILAFLFPLFVICAIAIKIDSKGPIFYRWRIIGQKQKIIKSYKFRSMTKDAEEHEATLREMGQNEMGSIYLKMKRDPRITSVGKILRKYSIDEIPYLISVIKGDMSLVGARPVRLSEYNKIEDWHKKRFDMKPGLSSLWVIKGKNKIDNFNEIVKLDLEYERDSSFLMDIKILIKTIPIILFGKNY